MIETKKEVGDHTFVKCSNCDRNLLDILHTDPEFPTELKIRANCPCGDFSFPVIIKGRFHHCVPQEYIDNTERVDLFVDDIVEEKDYMLFIVKELK